MRPGLFAGPRTGKAGLPLAPLALRDDETLEVRKGYSWRRGRCRPGAHGLYRLARKTVLVSCRALARGQSQFGSSPFNECSHGDRLRQINRMASRDLVNG